MKYLLCVLSLLTASQIISAQSIMVHVHDKDNKDALYGAGVYWADTQMGGATDEDGVVYIDPPASYPAVLVSTYVGYENDSILMEAHKAHLIIYMRPLAELEETVISAKRKEQFIRSLEPLKTEVITQQELRKAACCNLSESFQTNASADVNFEDAVTGAKQIELLGLRGIYVQNAIENTPSLRGLAASFSMDNIPAPWIKSISIAKGAPSVRAGYEGITGSMNVQYKEAEDIGKLYLDIFANHTGRIEGNWMSSVSKDKWNTAIFANGALTRDRADRNNDGFYDQPEVRQVNLMNRWDFRSEKVESQFLIKGLSERRQSGQLAAPFRKPGASELEPYGIGIRTDRIEGFAKTGILLPGVPEQSIGLTLSGFYHQQDGYYGLRQYEGKQGSLFANAMYQGYIRNTNHSILAGASLMYDKYDELVDQTSLKRTDIIPGLAAEYTYKYLDKITLVTGLRADFPNRFKTQISPRLHFRYEPVEGTTIRLATGRGFRIPNVYAENVFIFASSRQLMVLEEPGFEAAWNMGISVVQDLKIGEQSSNIVLDFFHTRFSRQVIVDIDNGQNMTHIYNLQGLSYSNSFLAEWNLEPIKGLDVKLAYRFEDVRMTMDRGLLQRPMLSPHRGLLVIGYTTKDKAWMFNTNLSMHGRHRLPISFDGDVQRFSPRYAIWGAQVTRYQGKFEFFLGAENMLNVRQQDPILGADNPFGNNFDTYQVWGPIVGATAFGGIRMSLKRGN
jgi:outer membrane receptor protein involved in Fe transport